MPNSISEKTTIRHHLMPQLSNRMIVGLIIALLGSLAAINLFVVNA